MDDRHYTPTKAWERFYVRLEHLTPCTLEALMLRLADFPQLKLIAWNRREDDVIAEDEALAIYERNWRYVDQDSLDGKERALIERLVRQYGHGVLNV